MSPDKPETSQGDVGEGPSVAFAGIGLVKLVFTEVENNPEPPDGHSADGNLTTAASIGRGDGFADVKLDITVHSNRKDQPYLVELEVVGRFISHGATPEELMKFAKSTSPALMFPYVRQIVHTVTGMGRGGPILLPLLNTHVVLSGNWTEETEPQAAKPRGKQRGR